MHHFSVVRSLRSVRLLLPILLTGILGVLTSWATWTGYTARRPEPSAAKTARSEQASHDKLHLDQQYGRLPLSFEENRGQADASSKFIARGGGQNIFFTENEAILVFTTRNVSSQADGDELNDSGLNEPHTNLDRLARVKQNEVAGTVESSVLRMQFAGMKVSPEGTEELEGKVNYFLGSDSEKWISEVPTYGKVAYRDAYPGVDLLFYGNRQQLEYDLVVAPNADPGVIQMKFEGADDLKVAKDGSLHIRTTAGELTQAKPNVYQEVNGERKQLVGSYVLHKNKTIGFKVSQFDRHKPLIIDPILKYLSFINGSGEAIALSADANGNTFITGEVFDANLSATTGAYQTTFGGIGDCFVTKLSPSGTTALFTTYLGGSSEDYGNAVTSDANGNVYIGGGGGAGFPTTAGAYQTNPGSGLDGFVVKLNPTGSAIIFSTLIGGNTVEEVDSIALEQGTGNIFASGITASTDLVTTAGAYHSTNRGGFDGFIVKFNPNATAAIYLTYAGASGYDYPNSMAIDQSGSVYIGGSTSSLDFPTLNPVQSNLSGNTRGMFKTVNGGTSWSSIHSGLPTTYVFSTVINPTSPNIIYIGTEGGVFKSIDNGASWNPTGTIPTGRVHQLTLLPGAPNVIYAGTESGVFRSIDSGATWVARNTGLGTAGNPPDVRGIAVPASAPNTVYAATSVGVFKSTDNSGTWTAVNNGISNPAITALTNAIVVDPTSPNTLYVAVVAGQRVFKTVNGGGLWQPASTGLANSTVRALAINPTTPGTLFVANTVGVYKTTNGGSSWAAANSGLTLTLSNSTTTTPGTQVITIDPTTPTTVYAGATAVLSAIGASSAATVFKSTDSGATWNAQANGFGGMNASINTIAVDPSNSANVYTGTIGDVDIYVLKLNPSGSGAVYSTYYGGDRNEQAGSIAVDANGSAYVLGYTFSLNYPTSVGAFQTTLGGAADAVVTKFNPQGTVAYSTLVGGSDTDQSVGGLAVDSAGNAYITGLTFSTDFPTTSGAFQRTIGNPGTRAIDSFVSRLNPAGSALDFSSYLGGDGNDHFNLFFGNRLALDAAQNVYLANVTSSTNFPYFDWANFSGVGTIHTFVAKISTTVPSYSVTGRITNNLAAGVQGIIVQASIQGQVVRSGVTDALGYYALISLPAGDYTVTPFKYSQISISHYTFSPATRSFPGLSTDQTANFVATPVFDISGTISHGSISNLGIFDVTVSLTGAASASTVTDVYGNFAFRDLVAGTYTVTPTKAGFTFTPVNRVFSNINGDQFTTFTTTSGTYVTVSGRAADSGNAAIANASIAMQLRPQLGSKEFAVQTDANGNYSFPNLQTGGNYNFQAFKAGLTFAPQQQQYNNLTVNQTLNFTGTGTTGLVGKIAFVKRTAQSQVAVINADGSGEAILTNVGDCGDLPAVWSPNGAKLAFSRCNANGDTSDLATMNADGSNVTLLVTDPAHSASFPTWAPEGTRLSYTFGECSGSDVLIPDVFAIDASGGLKTNLTNSPGTDGLSNWSPNGSSIVFSRGTLNSCSGTDGESDLYTMDAVGGNERQITNVPGADFLAVYSPDGSKIAFERSTQNLATGIFNDAIFVMNADGTGQTQLTPNVISPNKPTWSPDGTKIAFDGSILGAPLAAQIFVVNVDGTGLALITPADTVERRGPDWLHYSISGQVTGNTTGVPIIMTLAGTLTRVTRTDAAGNYVFGNLTPGGNYSVTPVSNAFGFSPAKIDVTNLVGNQIANFALQPAAIPAPTPPLADDFAAGTRDPAKWNLGTQTQSLGAFDPQVSVVQQGGQLVVTPRSQAAGAHYNGYVAVNSFDFNNAKATVEVVQPAANSAETIFAIGSDLDNYTRFVIRPNGGSNSATKGRSPKQVPTAQLIFQVRVGGQLTSISINYDPVAHRFMRFRHDPPPANAILFETSPNNVDFVVRHSVVLQKSVSALTAELSAGTTTPTDPGTAVFDNFNLVTNTFQFQVTGYTANETANRAIVTVTRSGDLSTPASVDYSTFDDTARQRTRYVPAVGTLNFAAGQNTRTFSVLLEDNALVEGSQSLSVRLLDSSGGGLNAPGRAIVTVDDNDTPPITTNPLDNAQFFVRQNYYDFLSRSPDPGGLDYWTGQITQCGSDQTCINAKRIDVSNAFYFELEFQQTGSYVYRLYRVAYGNNQPSPNPNPNANYPGEDKKLLSYISFVSDRARVIGGAGLAQSQLNLANAFIKRSEFIATYPLSLDGPGFVDAVLAKMKADIGVDLASQRAALISLFNSGGRGAVIYRLADDNVGTNPINNRPFIDAEYNRAFVATQYYGYLRRNPDIPGFVFWLSQVNSGALRDVNKQHAMVCSFVTSAEYQQRLSTVSTHSNTECPQ